MRRQTLGPIDAVGNLAPRWHRVGLTIATSCRYTDPRGLSQPVITGNSIRGILVYSTQAVWLIAIIAIIVGAAGGYFFSRSQRRDGGGGKQSEQELRRVQLEQQIYRQRVTEHFSQTAELLSQLASNYRDVHNHLAQGARELCDADAANRLQPIGERGEILEAKSTAIIEPPRDYALREDEGTGTLDETFGLDKPSRAPLPEPPRY